MIVHMRAGKMFEDDTSAKSVAIRCRITSTNVGSAISELAVGVGGIGCDVSRCCLASESVGIAL